MASNDDREAVLRPGGALILTCAETGKQIHADTITCCHCCMPFVPRKGSGVIRGFCTGCNARTCGMPGCDAHYPFEKKMDDFEKGKLLIL
jgi:hypothetical protein